MPRVRRGIVPVVVCALVTAGCGSSGKTDTTPRLTRAESEALTAQLERARTTAAAQDLAGTKTALQGFKAQVARLRRAGHLSDATARSLRIGAARALARATSDSAPPPAPIQTTPAPAPPPAPVKEKKHDKKDHGKHKGHGGKGDE
jgi:hypothetical protein